MTLTREVRSLVDRVRPAFEGTAEAHRLGEIAKRLDGPLRVAVAGKVKAGKSTLLNALVGEELAPTDAGECTRIVTWYREGLTYRVLLTRRGEELRQVPFRRDSGPVEIGLQGARPEDVERLVVEWPAGTLRTMTLIDTPGLVSLSTDVSDRTTAFLTPQEDEPTAADAVLYLMRHVHASDVRFLESFHDEEVSKPSPVNAIGVLSRADEVGGGSPRSLDAAERIAARYRGDPNVRRLCLTVVPVSGLLAFTGETLVEDEYRALGRLAEVPVEEQTRLLLTADRFANAESDHLSLGERRHLLDRLGVFGLRFAAALIGSGRAPTARRLSEELIRASGLPQLRQHLETGFTRRADVLKARSALAELQALAETSRHPATEGLAEELERIEAGAHELAELRLLTAIRAGDVSFRDVEAQEAERLLGGSGSDPASRVGLRPEEGSEVVREELLGAIARWRARAESPVSGRAVADAAQVLVRSCEGLVAQLASGPIAPDETGRGVHARW